ncbi:TIGR04282 family arsenosugar biosynthesis glycosyltransferase [Algoriphagus aestuarii]|nr:TIGR04282 family arsenosugar biosynthesis glycosyltransferase [Algoriphagus aestuarii]
MRKGIIIFQKNAQLGKVKTRLAAGVGEEQALEIYKGLISVTYAQVSKLKCKKLLYFSEFVDNPDQKEDESYSFHVQSDGDLGQKMASAFQEQFQKGCDKLLIIGTDCPGLTSEILEEAFEKLDHDEVVIGPANDGGYYLLGMKTFIPGLFQKIPWSSEKVLSLSKKVLDFHSITYSLLPTLIDVDTLEDWKKVKKIVVATQE